MYHILGKSLIDLAARVRVCVCACVHACVEGGGLPHHSLPCM